MYLKLKIIICLFFGVLISCTASVDPIDTTNILSLPIPLIKEFSISNNIMSLTINSFVVETGDLQGAIIYLSSNENDIEAITSVSLNEFSDVNDKTGVISIISTNDFDFDQTGKQIITANIDITSLSLDKNQLFFLGVTVYGQNDSFARINQHRGFFESNPDTNYNFSFADITKTNITTNNTLTFNNGCVLVDDTISDLNLIYSDSFIFLEIDNISCELQDRGFSTDFTRVQTLPTEGYLSGVGRRIPLIEGHIYSILKNNYYYKIYIESLAENNIGLFYISLKNEENRNKF